MGVGRNDESWSSVWQPFGSRFGRKTSNRCVANPQTLADPRRVLYSPRPPMVGTEGSTPGGGVPTEIAASDDAPADESANPSSVGQQTSVC